MNTNNARLGVIATRYNVYNHQEKMEMDKYIVINAILMYII